MPSNEDTVCPADAPEEVIPDSGLQRPAIRAGTIMARERFPRIDSHESLLKALEDELGYCTCAYGEALPLLRDFLRLVVERTEGVGEPERYRIATDNIRTMQSDNGSTALRSWFIYTLDRADLLMHGFNLYDVWATAKGRWLLAGLEQFAQP
jgi:hypothetical protein